MVVVADADLLSGDEEHEWSAQTVLQTLLRHPLVDLYRYADTGPPPDARHRQHAVFGNAAIGWVKLGPELGGAFDARQVTFATTRHVTRVGIAGDACEMARRDEASSCYANLKPAEAAVRRQRDMLAVQAAQAASADVFISDRPYLRERSAAKLADILCCAPAEALPLVSLYLRAQGEYLVMGPPIQYNLSRSTFFSIAARELMPEGWRWFAACTGHDRAQGVSDMTYLARSLFERLERALWARDDLHRTVNRPPRRETSDLTLEALDRLLLFLMGAFDVAARVAHRTLELSGSERDAGWQKQRWLGEVAKIEPGLSSVLAVGTEHRHVLTILAYLRNSVHGPSLSNVNVRIKPGEERNLLLLPRDERAALLTAMDALGGRNVWGVEQLHAHLEATDSALLVEELFPRAISLLNDVMRKTPVERLNGVKLRPEDLVPPPGEQGHMDPLSEEVRLSIRWQLGL